MKSTPKPAHTHAERPKILAYKSGSDDLYEAQVDKDTDTKSPMAKLSIGGA
jgi:hypothetical protein